ncbi:MAG: Gldg family protein [Lachnospiraceae bacterium]|nr:Gldg family protein [Lachnospiraceae bacterium]
MNIRNIIHNKKFRYGTFSVVFTVVVVILIIVLNVIASSLYQKYRPNGDMTKTDLYTLSDASKEILSDITAPVRIIFCAMPDQLEAKESMRYVYYSALEYEKAFDNITVECRDIYTNPTSMDKYKTSQATQITQSSVVIESGTEFRLFALQAFYKTSSETGKVFAYDGEMKITSAILQLTASDMPIAYFTNTHGESVESASATTHSALWTTFENAGFDVRLLDLSTEEISPDARIIVINNPLYDFSGRADSAVENSEIEKLDNFLSDYGSLVVFRDPVLVKLPNLDEYLEEWGVQFKNGTIRDKDHSISLTLGGMPYSGYGIVAMYPESGLGSSVLSAIRDLDAPPKTIVPLAAPIVMLDIMDSSKDISPILTTYPGANLESDGKTVEEGKQYNLMTLSRYTRVKDNTEFYSYLLACGSPYYTSMLESTSYANQDILYSAIRAMGKEKVPADIDFKLISSEALDITEAEQTQWTWLLIFGIPFVIAVIGVIVYVRRKHS